MQEESLIEQQKQLALRLLEVESSHRLLSAERRAIEQERMHREMMEKERIEKEVAMREMEAERLLLKER